MIKIKNIRKKYDSTEILKGIDLNVEDGKVVAIIGPSGSGKTTFLRCINHLESPDEGVISIGGSRIIAGTSQKKDILDLQRKTAFVFQNYNLFRNKTAIENVMLALTVVKKYSKKKAREIAEEMLDKVSLPRERFEYYPSSLSGGQQQRIAIARALALNPELMLLDEPTSALDPELVDGVLDVIRAVAKEGITLIVVTHELSFAAEVADEVVFMDQGEIVEKGKALEVLRRPRELRTKAFLRSIQREYSKIS
ncbi:MAG: amino acid ABC transporter ATP-binding protein [Lachnospiraceae bacterium]|nr:amino acid ABC transporter ATP-binding protein [Lachnospiraceae bacterium]